MLDFDPARPGTQALAFAPDGDGQHISYVAGHIVEEQITAALARAGYPDDTRIDVVGFSMGGLVARFLLEHPGADVDHFSAARGWFGDGTPDVAGNWAERIDDLIMLGTPSHGTWLGFVPGTIGGFGRWNPTGGDMRPGSPFLDRMGRAEPAGERYVTIGGAPRYLPFPAHDFNGDGVAHGYDGLVPAESPFLTGSEQYLVPAHHGAMVSDPQAVDLVVQALGRRATPPGVGEPNLVGPATVRLEHAALAEDFDWGTDDEFRFASPSTPMGATTPTSPPDRSASSRTPPSSRTGATGVRLSAPYACRGRAPGSTYASTCGSTTRGARRS